MSATPRAGPRRTAAPGPRRTPILRLLLATTLAIPPLATAWAPGATAQEETDAKRKTPAREETDANRQASAPSGTSAEDRTPLATLHGETIHVEEVEGALARRIFQHRLDIYSLLEAEAWRRIDARLLEEAARERGITVEALEAELASGTSEVSEAEVDSYLAEHPPRDAPDSAQVRERVRLYLSETRRLEERIAFMESLREQAGARILLDPPTPPRSELELAGAPDRGPRDAPIVVVHFASLGSEASLRSIRKIARLREELPGRVRWLHRHLLREHDELGLAAARIAFTALEQGRFWAFHDALARAKDPLDLGRIREIARASGLPAASIETALSDPGRIRQIKHDIDLANASGVPRAPGLFVNGLFVSGLAPYEDIRAVVTRELERLGESSQSGESATQ